MKSASSMHIHISNSYKLELRKDGISSQTYFHRRSWAKGIFTTRRLAILVRLFLLGLLSVFRTDFRNRRAESRVKTRDSRSRSIRLGNTANEPGCKALQSAAVYGGISQSWSRDWFRGVIENRSDCHRSGWIATSVSYVKNVTVPSTRTSLRASECDVVEKWSTKDTGFLSNAFTRPKNSRAGKINARQARLFTWAFLLSIGVNSWIFADADICG